MKNMTLQQIALACDGEYVGDDSLKNQEIIGITTDSREAKEGWLFIPIRGERVDGHSFITDVIKQGAIGCLSEERLSTVSIPYILVSSSLEAIKKIATYYREQLDIKVIGVTGSVGKTSTKEMIASVLSSKYSVLKTLGNFNNELGLPLTIFRIREEEVAVLEMGISDFKEMHRLSNIAKPDICVLTNIGDCHLENLKDREGVLRAKSEIFDGMKKGGSVLINGDDEYLNTITSVQGKKPISFGITNHKVDIYADQIEDRGLEGTKCTIHMEERQIEVQISIPGYHMVYNALAGAAAGFVLGLTLEEIKQGIESLVPVAGRNHLIKANEMTIIDDCYNANPVSMKASIDVLQKADTRTVAILGDMFELGAQEISLHKEVGEYLAKSSIDVLLCAGELSRYLAEEVKDKNPSKEVVYFRTREELLQHLNSYLKKGDTILVKASNGMKFKEVVEKLSK